MNNKNSGKRWSEAEKRSLKKMAKSGETTKGIAKELGRSIGAITGQASILDISLLPIDK
jgi:transposase-like protein